RRRRRASCSSGRCGRARDAVQLRGEQALGLCGGAFRRATTGRGSRTPSRLLTCRLHQRRLRQDGEVRGVVGNIHQLAPDEPLPPELVLVFPPEPRSQALASLPAPAWLTLPRRTVAAPPAPVVDDSLVPSLGVILVSRVVQLTLVFVSVTIVILAMSLVANAM